MVDITAYKKPQDKKKLVYPDIPSSIAPVPHDEHLPVPESPEQNEAYRELLDKYDEYEEEQEA